MAIIIIKIANKKALVIGPWSKESVKSILLLLLLFVILFSLNDNKLEELEESVMLAVFCCGNWDVEETCINCCCSGFNDFGHKCSFGIVIILPINVDEDNEDCCDIAVVEGSLGLNSILFAFSWLKGFFNDILPKLSSLFDDEDNFIILVLSVDFSLFIKNKF